jgi:hypothetical protein
MNLLFVSHKESWPDPHSPSGFATNGGFPYQIQRVSQLFDQTLVLITQPDIPAPNGLIPLQGHAMTVKTLPTPSGGRWHKLKLIPWVLKNIAAIWQETARADAVHAAVPGDVGSIGLVVALLQGKRLYVRHCGTYGEPVTKSDHILLWLLERIASKTRVVFATGGSDRPPSKKNPHISWIFSTTLTQTELDQTPSASPWTPGGPLRLVTVGRLAEGKNMQATIRALARVKQTIPGARLDVLGDGEYRPALEKLTGELGLKDSIAFHGNVNHEMVLNILSQSHLFVFPTRVKEGFPKAVLEALACGLPVIATRVSVIPQLLQNGSGLLLDDTDAPAVADAILQLTAQPERLAEMGRLAREAAQGYTLEAWGEAIGQRLRAAWGPLKEGEA